MTANDRPCSVVEMGVLRTGVKNGAETGDAAGVKNAFECLRDHRRRESDSRRGSQENTMK